MKAMGDALRTSWTMLRALPPMGRLALAWLSACALDLATGWHAEHLVYVAAAIYAFKDHVEFVAPWWDEQSRIWHHLRHRANRDGWTRVARLYEGDGKSGGTALNVYVRMRRRPERATMGSDDGFVTLEVAMRRGTEGGYWGADHLAVTIGVASGRGEFVFPIEALVEAAPFRMEIDVKGTESIFTRMPEFGRRSEEAKASDGARRASGGARKPDAYVATDRASRIIAKMLQAQDLGTREGLSAAKRAINLRFRKEACGLADADPASRDALARANNHLSALEAGMRAAGVDA